MELESAPTMFAGTVFALFGAGLLLWTWGRIRHRAPVADGVNPIAAVTLASLAGAGALALGCWCLTRI